MKIKLNRIILIILIVWFLIFVTDMISVYIGSKPIFVIPYYGGEITEFRGIGYSISYFYPLTSIDNPVQIQSSFNINALVYVSLNVILVGYLIISTVIKKKKMQSNDNNGKD